MKLRPKAKVCPRSTIPELVSQHKTDARAFTVLQTLQVAHGTFFAAIAYPKVVTSPTSSSLAKTFGFQSLIVALNEHRADIPDLFSSLAERLYAVLPNHVRLRHKTSLPLGMGSILGVGNMVLELGDHQFHLKLERGSLHASSTHVVGGIGIKTEKLEFDEFMMRVMTAIESEAGRNAVLRSSLEKLIGT